MKKTLITQEQFKVMPWKNKAGVTVELAIHPADADFTKNNFNWRLSSAHIQDENQFSKFPGYDRLLTVLSGEGLLLNGEELAPFNLYSFSGDEDIQCSLVAGPVEDLGLIYRRDKYTANLQIIEVVNEQTLHLGLGVHFIMTLSDSLFIDQTEVISPHILQIEDAQTVQLKTDQETGYALKISILEKSMLQ